MSVHIQSPRHADYQKWNLDDWNSALYLHFFASNPNGPATPVITLSVTAENLREVGIHGKLAMSSAPYPTPAGMWPSNVLLAGILVDSPLALPLSTELWSCSTFIDASKNGCPKLVERDKGDSLPLLRLTHDVWAEWRKTIEKEPAASDTGVLAKHFLRHADGGPLYREMLRRLAAAIDITAVALEEAQRATILAEVAVVPYLLSRGVQPDVVFGEAPIDISKDFPVVDRVTELFERWGLKVNRES
jgi:hypothetical protein